MTSEPMPPTAVVMNMFYTGLGIARSLGEHGIPVVGLTSQRGIYGNFTRYARTVFCPDSRREPVALRKFLISLGREFSHRPVIFPTRDDDILFLDRFRADLTPHFNLAIPPSSALNICLDKWETYLWAKQAGVATPTCWRIGDQEELDRVLGDVTYPCVMKPLAAHQWRQGDNWRIVGARKAIGISSPEELRSEYRVISRAGKAVLVQQLVPGGDQSLVITACYLDSNSRWVAGFNTQKLVQAPEIFGTGCIVQAADHPELIEPTTRLLETIRFSGIAEVEYKWDAAQEKYQLIEINPRPWDQHRLGLTCGVDLVHLQYCEHAGLPRPAVEKRLSKSKWIAEDTFILTALSLLWRRDPKLRSLFRLARGNRVFAIWSARDPIPFLAYFAARFVPGLLGAGAQALWSALTGKLRRNTNRVREDVDFSKQCGEGKSHG